MMQSESSHSTKNPNCPNCNTRMGVLDRSKYCALCKKAICSRCIQYGRFCEQCAEDVPKYYRECYSSLNWFSVIFCLIIGFSLMGQAWWRFSGWVMTSIADNVGPMLIPITFIIVGFAFVLLAPFAPKLGTWLFYHKMKNKRYPNMILDEMEDHLPPQNFSLSRFFFNIKEKIINWHVETKFKTVYIFGLLLNLLIFWFLIAYFTKGFLVPDTNLSNIAGYLFVISVICNYLTLFLAATFYSNKSKENRLNRLIIEFLSWFYAFILPYGFLQFIVGMLIQFQYLSAISITVGIKLIEGAQGIFRLSTLIILALQGLLLLKAPYIDRNTIQKRIDEKPSSFFGVLYSKGRGLITLFFVMGVVIAFILSILILITDPLYVFNVMGYMINFIYLFFIFGAIKLVKSWPELQSRIRISKKTIAKFGAVILIINISPAIGTTLGTNISLNQQFAVVFGENWDSLIVGNGITTKNLPLSCWDAFFTTPVPSNGYYDILYGTDSPRYVIDPISGNVISAGSQKYTSVVHEFKFDLYLPAGERNNLFPVNLTPGDRNSQKYPLVVMIHGLAADRGIMNANITSQILANYGYAVCDISYGDFDWYNSSEINTTLEKGYDLPDTIFQVANFFQFIENNSDYYHVDVSNTALVGRSWGGFMSLVVAYGYNHSFFAGNFSSNTHINSLVVLYPTSKMLTGGENIFELGQILSLTDSNTPIIRGSDNPISGDYNAQWKYFDPFFLSGDESGLTEIPNTMILQGTHDFGIPPGWSRDLENHLRNNNRKVIAGYYPLAAHGFDALVWSPFGQSTLYYMCRFFQLSNQ